MDRCDIVEYIRLSQVDFKNNIGGRVFATFLARDVSVRLQKDKVTKFIVLNMVDKSTTVEARLFGASDNDIETIKEGGVFNAALDVKPYDKASSGYSCIIYNIDKSNAPPEMFADWATDLDESRNIINNVINNYYDTIYGKIAYKIITKHWEKFSKWTAASSMHHTKLGDLLKHTSEVVAIAEKLADYFNSLYCETFINKPLLLCTAIIHDIGKIQELDVDTLSGKTEYSAHAVLATHIMDGMREISVAALDLGLGRSTIYDDEGNAICNRPDEEVQEEVEAINLMQHCLAAHHGKLEYGSPITASVPEATILAYADNLSAEMNRYNKAFEELGPGEHTSSWASGQLIKMYKDTTKIDDIEV